LTLVAFAGFGIFLFRGLLRQRLRFPMGIAVIFWATGHLLANGDLASVILFGGLLAYAVAHIAIGTVNGVRPSPDVRSGHDLLSIVMGVALYAVMAQLHGVLIGVPVFSLT
jgi:NnrU protein